MYRIGMFSKICLTTVKTLRYYDEVGLLEPSFVDEENGYRYYTSKQLYQFHEIAALKQMGLSIPQILSILSGHCIDEIVEGKKQALNDELATITDQLFRLNHYSMKRKEGIIVNYQVIIKNIPECVVFSKRQIIADYSELMTLVPSIGKKITQANPGLKCALPEYCFNVYHDGEYREKNIDVEICEAVEEFGVETDGIVFKKMPSATVASVMHKGPYEDLGLAYAYVYRWIEENGYEAVDYSRESFIDGIWNKENKSEWLTEIQVPVKKK